MAPRDRKRSTPSSRGSHAKGPAKAESTEDALEKLFAEAMGSVRTAREASKPMPLPAEPDAPAAPPAELGVDIDVELDDSFLDEQSIHYVIDEEDSEIDLPSLTGTLETSDDSFDSLDADLMAALDEDDEDDDEDDGDEEDSVEDDDIRRFIAESFGENALSDEDPDLAFPDFGDEESIVIEEEEDSEPPPKKAKSLKKSKKKKKKKKAKDPAPPEEEVFALDDGTDEVQLDIGRPVGTSEKKRKSKKKKKKKKKTALPGPSIDDALRARVAELGRILEERDIELRASRDRINGMNAQLVAANRRGAAISREFETYRKRAERDREDHKKYAAEKVLKEFLGVFDNLERALEHAGVEKDGPLGQGVSMTLHQFGSALAQNGVVRVDGGVGAKFDPVHHEAVGQTFSDDVPLGAIVNEMQAGFTLHGRLLRAAMVVVSRGVEGAEPPPEESPAEDAEATAPADAVEDVEEAEDAPEAEAEEADAAADAEEASSEADAEAEGQDAGEEADEADEGGEDEASEADEADEEDEGEEADEGAEPAPDASEPEDGDEDPDGSDEATEDAPSKDATPGNNEDSIPAP